MILALGPGMLLLSAMAPKFLSDNQYLLFLFLTWLPLGNPIISEVLELIENMPGQCLALVLPRYYLDLSFIVSPRSALSCRK